MDHREAYRRRLCTPEAAAARIPDRALVVQGNAIGAPPALLAAVAARARTGGFSELRMTALLPLESSARSILADDLRGVIHWESIFASGVDRRLLAAGQAVYVPAYFHQVPRLFTEFMDVDVALKV